ncbi:MAG: hypothetical protein AB8H47_13445 [Bacteroidia bacterium]
MSNHASQGKMDIDFSPSENVRTLSVFLISCVPRSEQEMADLEGRGVLHTP